ncbi:conserved hypothetical protein [Aspergillus terreus NIH2624]|uniref:Rhodopsin domain-containing protein n=1 Tax=Aspergillus terreus (strain NIH 2624 / FGSC A1156) TaxID=341663 RepID=Q0CAM6_ASPTN|nr:uncharacterized protein ATEG_09258 [Aspergillus terreus NIH2624]EAU30395.1 conserved hypothetical protein [Aspergillus terreus NIH2624]
MAYVPLLGRDAPEPSDSIDDTVQKWNKATQSLCIIFTTIFFILRVYTRTFILNGFTKEDWFCSGAWPSRLTPQTVYVTMVMYGPTAFLTKMSLLWIMTRVFSPFRKSVIFIYVFLALMLAYYIPAVIVKIRICSPISKFWDTDTPGTCLGQSSIIMADAVVSVVSDMIVLILPLPLTLGLQLPTKKKMRVMAILGAGGLACASSIIRLVLIVFTGQSADGTWAFMRINMFGNAEIAIGVICACLPALSALISRTYKEYSSNKYTGNTDYELRKYAHPSRNTQTQKSNRSRSRMSFFEPGSDQDILVQNVQSEPKVETTVQQSPSHQRRAPGFGIMKTVNVTTEVSSARGHPHE